MWAAQFGIRNRLRFVCPVGAHEAAHVRIAEPRAEVVQSGLRIPLLAFELVVLIGQALRDISFATIGFVVALVLHAP